MEEERAMTDALPDAEGEIAAPDPAEPESRRPGPRTPRARAAERGEPESRPPDRGEGRESRPEASNAGPPHGVESARGRPAARGRARPPRASANGDAPEQANGREAALPPVPRVSLDVVELSGKTKEELLDLAPSVGLQDTGALANLHREDVLGRLFQVASAQQSLIATGILEIMDEGYGFLRQVAMHRSGDVYISQSQIRRFGLRTGDTVTGQVRPPKEGERYFGLVRVEQINGFDTDKVNGRNRPVFEHLTPVFPERQVVLESSASELSTRMVDLFAPIGLGQRGLIVSPPKAGKTTMLKQIAHGVVTNCPEAVLMVALIGERPEEVTDMRRSRQGRRLRLYLR